MRARRVVPIGRRKGSAILGGRHPREAQDTRTAAFNCLCNCLCNCLPDAGSCAKATGTIVAEQATPRTHTASPAQTGRGKPPGGSEPGGKLTDFSSESLIGIRLRRPNLQEVAPMTMRARPGYGL